MARPLRLEFAGTHYHVTSRSKRQGDVFLFDKVRLGWLKILGAVCDRFDWVVHTLCQMGQSLPSLPKAVAGNRPREMRQLNGWYTRHFNCRQRLAGHFFNLHFYPHTEINQPGESHGKSFK